MRSRVSSVVFLFPLLLSCSDSTGPAPVTSLQIVGSAQPVGVVDETLDDSVAVRAVDASGNPRANVAVTFAVTDGDGFVSPTVVRTDAEGVARASWRLGTTAGVNVLTATVNGVPPAVITATAEPGAATEVTIAPADIVFASIGDSVRVTATARDQFGNALDSEGITFNWVSLDESIATVDAQGWVRAVSQGTAQIRASIGTASGSVAARVDLQYGSLELGADEVTINALTFTRALDVVVRDARGTMIADPALTWQSRSPGVATVDAFGEVRAVAPGATWIVVTGQGLADSVLVRVRQVASRITLTAQRDTMLIGDDLAVTATAIDSSGAPIVNPVLTWTSTRPSTAQIVDGQVSAVGPGSVTIRATDGAATGSADFTVFFPDVVLVPFSAGGNHSLAIRGASKQVYAWGYNSNGQVGNGTTTQQNLPLAVAGMTDIIAVSGGWATSIALRRDGQMFGWGRDADGQLGLGTTATSRTLPVALDPSIRPVQVHVAQDHVLLLLGDGTVLAAGDNPRGQLGDGTTTSRDEFAPVPGLTDIIQIAGGTDFSMALRDDGTVWAWGGKRYGQVGNGTGGSAFTEVELSPVQVSGLTNIVRIANGRDHGMALRADGTLWTWGRNHYGQLGNGTGGTTSALSTVPVQVTGLSTVVRMGGGDDFSTAVLSDGTLWAWGRNSVGGSASSNYCQLGGASTNTIELAPVQLAGITNAVDVQSGIWFSLFERSDDSIWAFGRGTFGQRGDGTTVVCGAPPNPINLP